MHLRAGVHADPMRIPWLPKVRLHVRPADGQASGRRSGGVVRALLGHQLWLECRHGTLRCCCAVAALLCCSCCADVLVCCAAATEWRQVAIEAFRAAVVLAILERCFATAHATWLEDHIDYLSLQARCCSAACPLLATHAVSDACALPRCRYCRRCCSSSPPWACCSRRVSCSRTPNACPTKRWARIASGTTRVAGAPTTSDNVTHTRLSHCSAFTF